MHEGHRKRLKDRFAKEGLKNFESHQVLEMLLFFCIPRRDTNETAHKLIKKFGSFNACLDADIKDLQSVDGISENSAIFLSMIKAISGYYAKSKFGEKVKLDSSTKAAEYVVSLFWENKYELFYLICMDNQNRVTFSDAIFEGTVAESWVYPRNLIEIALRHNACSVIIAHNHPGGSLRASKSDIDTTNAIKAALNTINIRLLDHIIVADGKHFSMAEKGMI